MDMISRWTFMIALMTISGRALSAAPLSLNDFLNQVQTENPDLQIDQALTTEAAARADGSRINPPMIGLMQMKDSSGTNRGLEIEQQIPFPTKIKKDIETRQLESEVQKSNQAYRRALILNKARIAYFEFWGAFEKLNIAKEKRDWLKMHAKISRSATRSDSAAQVHLLGIESEVDLLENEVVAAETNLGEKRLLLKTYAPEMSLTEIKPVTPPLEKINLDPKSKSIVIQWKEKEAQAAEANKSLQKQAYLPDIIVRYRGYNGNELMARSEELMVGITLPFLFFWQPKSESAEALGRSQRAQAELKKAEVETEVNLKSISLKIENLNQQLSLLDSKILPRAHKRMALAENLSQRTMEGLNEHRTVMLDYLEMKLKSVDLRLELEKSISELLVLIDPGAKQ